MVYYWEIQSPAKLHQLNETVNLDHTLLQLIIVKPKGKENINIIFFLQYIDNYYSVLHRFTQFQLGYGFQFKQTG